MDRDDMNRISLIGDLSMIGVTEQFPRMVHYLDGIDADAAASSGQHNSHEIDLTGIQTIDACGCQLLVTFVRNLKKHGAVVSIFKLTDDCRTIIHTLGFDDELYAGGRV